MSNAVALHYRETVRFADESIVIRAHDIVDTNANDGKTWRVAAVGHDEVELSVEQSSGRTMSSSVSHRGRKISFTVGGIEIVAQRYHEAMRGRIDNGKPFIRLPRFTTTVLLLVFPLLGWLWAIDRMYRLGGTDDANIGTLLDQGLHSTIAIVIGVVSYLTLGYTVAAAMQWLQEPKVFVRRDVFLLGSDIANAVRDSPMFPKRTTIACATVALGAICSVFLPTTLIVALVLLSTLLRHSTGSERVRAVIGYVMTRHSDSAPSTTSVAQPLLIVGVGLLVTIFSIPAAVALSIVLALWVNNEHLGQLTIAIVVAFTLTGFPSPARADDGGYDDFGCTESFWAATCEGREGVIAGTAPVWLLLLIGTGVGGVPAGQRPDSFEGGGPGPQAGKEPARPKGKRPPGAQGPPKEPAPKPEKLVDQNKRNKARKRQREIDERRARQRARRDIRNRQRRKGGYVRPGTLWRGLRVLGFVGTVLDVMDLADSLSPGPRYKPIDVYPTEDPGVYVGTDGVKYQLNDDGYLTGPWI